MEKGPSGTKIEKPPCKPCNVIFSLLKQNPFFRHASFMEMEHLLTKHVSPISLSTFFTRRISRTRNLWAPQGRNLGKLVAIQVINERIWEKRRSIEEEQLHRVARGTGDLQAAVGDGREEGVHCRQGGAERGKLLKLEPTAIPQTAEDAARRRKCITFPRDLQ